MQGIEQISYVIQTNSATVQQSAAASEELPGQSNILQQHLNRIQFRYEENPSQSACVEYENQAHTAPDSGIWQRAEPDPRVFENGNR